MIKILDGLKKFVRPKEHSLFSPSGADRWMKCPASIPMSRGIADPPTSKYALQGTIAHEVCEDYAKHALWDLPLSARVLTATEENMRSARGWVEVIKSWMNHPDIGQVLYIGLESGLPIYPDQDCFGTADALIIGTKGCAVIDFKNGVGHVVGARSPQLQVYLLSVLLFVEGLPEDYKFNSVVYQPRVAGGDIPKEATYTLNEMRSFNLLVVQAIETANQGQSQPVMGSHCHWCKVKRTCPAQHNKQVQLANERFGDFLAKAGSPDRSTRDQALVKLMSLKPLIDKVCKDAEEEFRYRLVDCGEIIQGLDVISKQGNRTWAHEEKDMIPLLQAGGVAEPVKTVTKLKTLTEVQKEIGKAKFNEAWCIRPITKKVIVQDDKVKNILGELAAYGKSLVEDNSQGEV